jgi:hypothetical protein
MTQMEVVPDAPFCCCMPWRLRSPEKAAHGRTCFACGRDIAAPPEAAGKRVACIYCGLDHGWIPAVEIPPAERPEDDERWMDLVGVWS